MKVKFEITWYLFFNYILNYKAAKVIQYFPAAF